MKKIIIILNDFSNLGGVEKVTENLFNLFVDENLPVYKIVSIFNNHNVKNENVDFLIEDSTPFKIAIVRDYVIENSITDVIIQVQSIQLALEITLYLNSLGVNVFNIFHTSPYFYFKWYFPNKLSSVVTFLQYLKKNFYWSPKNYKDLSILIQKSHKFICVGTSVANEVDDLYKKEFSDKILAIENPFLFSNYSRDNSKKENIILFAGRFSEEKQIGKLLAAWKKVNNKEDWEFILLGSGHLLDYYKNYTLNEQIENVTFMGKVDDVETYLKKSKITILYSMFEGFPTILLEGANYGNVLIGLNGDGGTKDLVIDNINGILLQEDNINSLQGAIEKLIHNTTLLQKMAEGNHIVLDKYSSQIILEKWKKLL